MFNLSTTQWLALGSIVISLISLYYRREELKAELKPHQEEKQAPQMKEPPPQFRRGVRVME